MYDTAYGVNTGTGGKIELTTKIAILEAREA